MKNEVQVKDYSRIKKRYIIGLVLYVILMSMLLILYSMYKIENSVMLMCTIIFIILLFAYMFCVYSGTYKAISMKEFLKLFSDYSSDEIENILFDSGFNEDEIIKVLKKMKPNEKIEIKKKTEQIDNISTKQNNYIYCQKCGEENSKDTSFCINCGSRLSDNCKYFGVNKITNDDLKEDFHVSKELLTKVGLGILIDSDAEEIAIIQSKENIRYIKFDQIQSYSVIQPNRGGGNKAIILGTLMGNSTLYNLGMANTLSGCEEIFGFIIRLVLNDVESSEVDINILHKKMYNRSNEFAEINNIGVKITTFLDKVISKSDKSQLSTTDNFSKIKELKELLDMGAITEEEFNKKKKELLK